MYDCVARVNSIKNTRWKRDIHCSISPHCLLLEVKYPYSAWGKSIKNCNDSNFCCSFENGAIQLCQKNHFCCKVQGQMALCAAKWYDFLYGLVTATFHDQVKWFFDKKFWTDMALSKLFKFYGNSALPNLHCWCKSTPQPTAAPHADIIPGISTTVQVGLAIWIVSILHCRWNQQ